MGQVWKEKIAAVPTPMAGLALAIASLGWCWENALPFHGFAQLGGAMIAAALLLGLAVKFVLHPNLLWQDLKHPVVGSVVPTFSMALMVISHAMGPFLPLTGQIIWLGAVVMHLIFLVCFIYHRLSGFSLHHMVPSWFVPPVGIIVADVAFPGGIMSPLAHGLLVFGLSAYALMLPVMIYRLIFCHEVPDAAKPTIAILAAPASLSLAGYLTVTAQPSVLMVALLASIGLLMTMVIYLALVRLLRLPFTPAYAAFTFPMVIGATALYKTAQWMSTQSVLSDYAGQIETLALAELFIATVVVGYVIVRYLTFYCSALTGLWRPHVTG
ncbi:TDT family transporter [Photobacterium sp. GJ3]|uniref:TDT family transporter n=1 Tax=Photobacterium sp. GJ3 TaxID=2829502 RepID=UPI001B8B380E|nr:TDT family transporter [Photobacterium sp. GJ3]QUJ66937.1 TDT family transporter [Photobacterium sp. GJ3]